MEQCFTLATTIFPEGEVFETYRLSCAYAALSALTFSREVAREVHN